MRLTLRPVRRRGRAASCAAGQPASQLASQSASQPASRPALQLRSGWAIHRRVAAICLAAGVLAGCTTGGVDEVRVPGERRHNAADRAIFLAMTGEAPGDTTPYVDVAGRDRLGRTAPGLPIGRHRPAATPAAKPGSGTAGRRLAQLKDLYAAVRQRLSDRDDEVQFRLRSLGLHIGRFAAAVRELNLKPGDPLPPNDATFRERMKNARDAMAGLRGDLSRLHGVALRLDGNLRAAAVIRRGIAAAAGLPGETGADRALRTALLSATDKSLKSGRKLRRLVGASLANFVEWISGQEQSLSRLERQVVARGSRPAGPRTLLEMINRETLIR